MSANSLGGRLERRDARPPARGRGCRLRLALALAGCLALALPAAARADVVRKEVVGVAPLRPGSGRSAPPRDEALQAAVARAVEDVAVGVLPRDWQPAQGAMPVAGHALAPALVPALGDDPFPYASRFRIVEDRGVRPALLAGPDADEEYVVLVEVFVDAARVRERLAAAGWIRGPAGQAGSRLRLVVEGLASYDAYQALRQTLLEDLDVRSALPVEMARGRTVLEIEGDYDPASLERALERSDREGLRVVPLDRDGQSLTVLVDWAPSATAPAPDGGSPPGGPTGSAR